MADKQYAQTIQRALDDEIANLVAQQPPSGEAAKLRRERAPAAPPAPQPIPAPAPATSAPPPPPAPGAVGGLRDSDEEKRRKESFDDIVAAQAYGSGPVPDALPAPASRSAVAPLPTQHTTLANLDQRIGRLMQVRDWIQEDGDIARLIDTVIGKQVQSSERRQARLTLALNVVFLLAGWALSLVATPSILGHLIGK